MNLLQQNSKTKMLLGQDGNSLVLLIVINVIIYILLSFTNLVYLANNSAESVFRAEVLSLISVPPQPQVFATRPWTLLSYMFAHFNLLELIGSMLWLFAFGYVLQQLAGNKKLIPIYLYAGLAGSVIFLLAVNVIPSVSENVNSVFPILGAGPAVMGIAVAATVIAPRYRFISMFNMPLWMLTLIFVAIRVSTVVLNIGTVGYGTVVGNVASLIAGGLMGSVFVWQLQKGNDWSRWMTDFADWCNDLFNPQKKHVQSPVKNQLFYKASQKPFEKTPHVTQQRIDDLLDKINIKGYNSLTEDEKDFLKKASKEEF